MHFQLTIESLKCVMRVLYSSFKIVKLTVDYTSLSKMEFPVLNSRIIPPKMLHLCFCLSKLEQEKNDKH